jgi:hypothetical protein
VRGGRPFGARLLITHRKEQLVNTLKLALEDLTVETFSTSSRPGARGTVAANSDWNETYRLSQCPGQCTDPYEDSEDGFCPSNAGTCVGCPRQTFADTCMGATGCGTCYPEATCDLQYGCGGNSLDLQMC